MRLALYADKEGEAKSIEVETKAKVKLTIDNLEFPEFDTIEEFVALETEEGQAIGFINRSVRAAKLQKLRAKMFALPKNANTEVSFRQLREDAKDLSNILEASERASKVNSQLAAGFSNIEDAVSKAAAEGRELMIDELQAIIAAARSTN